ncbi:Protein big brother [Eumeta japonica]|uniref:Protein big brother n=1 Tax=Eumeta variegata TaxID=151549 RepID=A0A4C1Y439_EUMVA|nr:Protein big brother [Eumeta japonica]
MCVAPGCCRTRRPAGGARPYGVDTLCSLYKTVLQISFILNNHVHIVSRFIMNGVCVRWRGWIDVERLDGLGCLELDEERAAIEDAALRDQIERYNQRLRDFEDKQRAYREHGDELRAHAHAHAPRCHQPRQPPHGTHPHPHPAHPVHIKPHSQGALIS